MMTNLETARAWVAWGAAPIPILYQDKKPVQDWKQYQTELPTDREIEKWFSTHAPRNIALATGHQGLTVVDFDTEQVYNDWLAFADKWPHIKALQRFTYQVQTAKGYHVYVRLPEATKSRPLTKADNTRWGIDIKSRGGMAVIPPSIHPSGALYRAINPGAPVWFVESLSAILPPEMLKNDRILPKQLQNRPTQTFDPWQTAMNPVQMGPGTVARVKAAYRLEDLLPVEQVTGADFYLTRCPLHDDHDPSMWVNTAQQICGCYAGCTQKPLDFINLFARINDLSNSEAIRELVKGL